MCGFLSTLHQRRWEICFVAPRASVLHCTKVLGSCLNCSNILYCFQCVCLLEIISLNHILDYFRILKHVHIFIVY